jgi:hypothetical protein
VPNGSAEDEGDILALIAQNARARLRLANHPDLNVLLQGSPENASKDRFSVWLDASTVLAVDSAVAKRAECCRPDRVATADVHD